MQTVNSTMNEYLYRFLKKVNIIVFNMFIIDIINVILYKKFMNDKNFFLRPTSEWQRRYEALRASFVERLPAKAVADRYGYSQSYVNLLRHQFIHEKIDFNEPPPTTDKSKRRRVDSVTRSKICNWREQHLSAGEITQLLSEDGVEISIRTVERILTEEGYPKLPRRTRLKIGITTKGAEVPASSEPIAISQLSKRSLDCEIGGVFLFAPFIEKLNIHQVLKEARLPESKLIPALNYFLSFLALKLIGTERYSHTGDHSFDAGLGLFTGLNVIPKCTAMSTYSYSLDPVHLLRLQKGFVKQASKLGLYNKHIINLDFHTVPHFGEDSELETHWAGARNKRMKGALTLFAQDADSKLILYTGADIRRVEAELEPWGRISIPHDKRKYPNPYVYESLITLKGYQGELRQIVMKGNGHENPAFLISNDLESPVELLVSNYSRRWRVENVISESMKFFSLNALPSPILTKVHFDVVMTMIADTLYSMLADKLRGFEDCDAPKVFRHFVRGKAKVKVNTNNITVTYPRRAHNPILRAVPWHRLPTNISWLENCQLNLKFK